MKTIRIAALLLIVICVVSLKSWSQQGTISKSALLTMGKIDVSVEDFDFDAEFEVVSYVVSAVFNGFCYEIINKGAAFNQKTIDLITRLKRGQRIYFENIKVKGPDGIVRTIDPLILKIM